MRTDRNRQEEALDDFDTLPPEQPDGQAAFLLVTKTCTTYPTTAGQVYCCNPVLVAADDTEGATPAFTADTGTTIFAANLGSKIPAAGTYLLGFGVGGRIVFNYSG